MRPRKRQDHNGELRPGYSMERLNPMRRPLLYSLMFHLAVLLVVGLGLYWRPNRLPEDQPIAVEIVTGPPSRAPVKAAPPPSEAAPVPKREASAPNPSTRTESAERVAPPKPADVPAPAQRPVVTEDKPEPQPQTPPAKAVPPKAEPQVAAPTPAPRPAEKPVEVAKETPVPKPSEPTKAAAPDVKPAPRKPTPDKQAASAEEPPPDKPTPAKKGDTKSDAKQVDPAKKPDAKPSASAKSNAKDDTFDALLKSVSETPKRSQDPNQRKATGTSKEIATNKAGDAPATASADQIAGLAASAQRQLNDCWSISPGTPGANEVNPFKVNVVLNKDGTATAAALVDNSLMSNPASRAVAESAIRAARSCKLNLPAELYNQWRQMIVTFDPKQALSG
ncbi:Cell division and transport-associated protein TolA [Arboricoccus pini]|uniref:Cell division and transport-associated protein TolA n=1 Tax=Arboricoccus pini TaxID=1963835 RepID=A0A212QT33_9PROT|nr:cell envelope integrity protein TolA [Arboricoccus pini]SNB62771.1 Cell division and transport-associated protein TolA [Arboricoccus pini]